GHVLNRPDTAGGIAGTDVFEVAALAIFTPRVPRPRVDDAGGYGVYADRRELDRQPAGEKVDGSVGDANPQISDIELECVHAREQYERATGIHLLGQVFGEHR